jgi:hypothetical protein
MNAATNLFNFLIANNYDDVTIMTDYDGSIVRGDDVAVWVNNNGECAVTGTVRSGGIIEWNRKGDECSNDSYGRKLFAKAQTVAF